MALHTFPEYVVGGLKQIFAQPVHLHLRVQESLYALYITPLALNLWAQFVRDYLSERYLLIISLASRARLSRPQLSLAQWLRQQGLQAHSVPPSYALVPCEHLDQLARLAPSTVTLADTTLSPDDVWRLDVSPLEMDTFAATSWQAAFHEELGNRMYCESRGDRFIHLLSGERDLLADVLSRFLRSYLLAQQQEQCSSLDDFPPLIHEQLWQYATQGLAPQRLQVTSAGLELSVALGTPDRSVCPLAQGCALVSQIQRGFVLRWCDGSWDLCSTEEFAGDHA